MYSSAPMLFITNTDSEINLNSCTFSYSSGTFLSAKATSEWGTSGSNGGSVTLTLTNQKIEGDFIVDSISSLSITMVNSSIKGKINTDKESTDISITLDAASSITLTGNSYISSLSNADTSGSNVNKGSYEFTDNEGNEYPATCSSSSTTVAETTTASTAAADSTIISDTTEDNTTDNDTFHIIRNSARSNLYTYSNIYSILLELFILFLIS